MKKITTAVDLVTLLRLRDLAGIVTTTSMSLASHCRNLDDKAGADAWDMIAELAREQRKKAREAMPTDNIDGVEEEKKRRGIR